MATYENKIAKEFVIYGSSRLGIYNGATSEGKRTLGNKKYELSNHLGNVLSVISDNKIGIDSDADLVADVYEPYVVSESDYYPFGMQMSSRSFQNEEYLFAFQGQETNEEIGTVHYKYREADIITGRFWSVDPLAFEYAYNSPFAFSENSTISFVELEGLEKAKVTVDPANPQIVNVTWEKVYYIIQTGFGAIDPTLTLRIKNMEQDINNRQNSGNNTFYVKQKKNGDLKKSTERAFRKGKAYQVNVTYDTKVEDNVNGNNAVTLQMANNIIQNETDEDKGLNGVIFMGKSQHFSSPATAAAGSTNGDDIVKLNPLFFHNNPLTLAEQKMRKTASDETLLTHEISHNFGLSHGKYDPKDPKTHDVYNVKGLMGNKNKDVKPTIQNNIDILNKNKDAFREGLKKFIKKITK